jgi:hypothetical protein
MKKDELNPEGILEEEMLPEYDLSGKQGVRGKYH